jgi:hypothetical protein
VEQAGGWLCMDGLSCGPGHLLSSFSQIPR